MCKLLNHFFLLKFIFETTKKSVFSWLTSSEFSFFSFFNFLSNFQVAHNSFLSFLSQWNCFSNNAPDIFCSSLLFLFFFLCYDFIPAKRPRSALTVPPSLSIQVLTSGYVRQLRPDPAILIVMPFYNRARFIVELRRSNLWLLRIKNVLYGIAVPCNWIFTTNDTFFN